MNKSIIHRCGLCNSLQKQSHQLSAYSSSNAKLLAAYHIKSSKSISLSCSVSYNWSTYFVWESAITIHADVNRISISMIITNVLVVSWVCSITRMTEAIRCTHKFKKLSMYTQVNLHVDSYSESLREKIVMWIVCEGHALDEPLSFSGNRQRNTFVKLLKCCVWNVSYCILLEIQLLLLDGKRFLLYGLIIYSHVPRVRYDMNLNSCIS